jgi:EAL domain-containing protein (putative c-di-GMP-specific phosphodiesterase class I)
MNDTAKPADTVLVVDDDEELRDFYCKCLRRAGYKVEAAADGGQAIEVLAARPLQAIVSDINMPVYTGLEFLRAVRERDLDIPVILVTGQPDVGTAAEAVEYGAFRYLQKPIEASLLIETVRRACEVHRVSKLRREAWELLGKQGPQLGDRASVEARYQVALSTLFLEFQPIVRPNERKVLGYEAFVRSAEPALQRPEELFNAAWRLGLVHTLGRTIRKRLADASASAPEHALFFLNVHPEELNDNELWSDAGALTPIARRVVLELSERCQLDCVSGLKTRLRRLREMGFRVALDNLGGGDSALGGFSRVEPEFVKLDRSLVAGIQSSARAISIVQGLTQICSDTLDILVIADGVDTSKEQEALALIGVSVLQGPRFGIPKRGFENPFSNGVGTNTT